MRNGNVRFYGGPTPLLRLAAPLFICIFLVLAPRGPAAAGYASVVVDADTGRVLHEVNANTRNYPASLTKMMTLYMVFEALERGELKLGQKLSVSARAAGQAPSKLGLKKGDTITVHDAILALIAKSANDVATVIAETLADSESLFAREMTRRARALGMRRTTFRNASGLPNRRQLTTARDIATLGRALLRDFPRYYRYFSTREFVWNGEVLENHNQMLESYPGADGIKTGYIRASGFNIAVSAERDGHRLIGVVLGGRTPKSRDSHMAGLLDRAFAASRPVRTAALTPPRPTPKPTTVLAMAEGDASAFQEPAPSERGWAIQVGAFTRFAPAHLAVTRAARNVPWLLHRTNFNIVPVKSDEGRIYRARLTGLAEARAREACRILAKKQIDCMTVPPGDGVATRQ